MSDLTVTRRNFGKSISLGMIGLMFMSMVSTVGCTFTSIYNAIIKYIPVGLSAVASILSILSGAGIGISPLASTILNLIKIGFADLQTAITQYQNSTGSAQQTALGITTNVLADIEANIQQFWNDLTIPDAKLAALCSGLLGIIVSTLQGFQTQLPKPTPPAPGTARAIQATLPKKIYATPKMRSVSQFRKDFNSLLTDAGYAQHKI